MIGADQILAIDQRIYEKPKNLEGAKETLLSLRGHTHSLYSAVSVAVDNKEVWQYVGQFNSS